MVKETIGVSPRSAPRPEPNALKRAGVSATAVLIVVKIRARPEHRAEHGEAPRHITGLQAQLIEKRIEHGNETVPSAQIVSLLDQSGTYPYNET